MRFVFGIVFGMALLIGCPPPDPANPSQGSIAPESVEIKNPPAETLFAGAEIRLETEVLPANATDKSLSWTVSPEGTVEVTNGVLTALKEGVSTLEYVSMSSELNSKEDIYTNALFLAGSHNSTDYTNTLTGNYVGTIDGGKTLSDSFFTAAPYRGAVPADNDWTRGWTL